MKNLIDRLINESNGFEIYTGGNGGINFKWTPNCKFIWLNTEGEKIGFLSENEIESFGNDYNDDNLVKEILSLKPGEMYDADGGINYYIRYAK